MTAAAPASPLQIVQSTDLGHHYLDVSSIDVSKTNPRKHFDKEKLAELTESIIRHGVLQPILVRPKGDRYELVAGERRLRATRDAAIGEIPAIVRELNDKEALEVQVIENLQRADLHPLEEAEGYALLLSKHGYDADTLAEKIGKSRSYVYARIKLAALCAPAKKALWKDEISHSIGLLIARIPDPDLQKEATKEILGGRRGEAWSYREVARYIEEELMQRLSDAPFDRADAELVPSAGPCTTCPMRTGNQKELFGDVKSADVCTNTKCFRTKVDAHWLRIQNEAKERGLRVLPESEKKRVFPYNGRFAEHSSGYVNADATIDWNSKRSFRTALGEKLPPITIAREPESGKVLELVSKKAAEEALFAAGVLKKEPGSGRRDAYAENAKRAAEKRKLERSVENAIIAEAQPKLAKMKLSTALLRIVTKTIAFSKASYGVEDLFKRRGLKYPDWHGREKAIAKFVDGLSDGEMALVCAELTMSFGNLEQRSAGEKDLVRQLAKLAGVKVDAIEKRIRAAAAAKKQARTAAKTKRSKKARAK